MNDLDCTLFYRVTFDIALAPGAEPGLPRALVAFMRKYLYDSWAGSELELPQDDRAWEDRVGNVGVSPGTVPL